MLFPRYIIDIIVDCAMWADKLTRADLVKEYIVTENDYTSNFTSAFRREVDARGIPGLEARIQVLNPSAERKYGADACVILESDLFCKVGIFEAKWPRITFPGYRWDSLQRSTMQSHFHSQLLLQQNYRPNIAIWEMFYCECPYYTQPYFMLNEVSSCVWHDVALSFSMARGNVKARWSKADLATLLMSSAISIGDIIEAMCLCFEGQRLPKDQYWKLFGDTGLPHSALIISYTDGLERPELGWRGF